MYICPNCNKAFENFTKFCSECGAPMQDDRTCVQPQQPAWEAPQQPAWEAPQPVQAAAPAAYAVPAAQPVQAPSKGKQIVGMALSIAGLAFAGLGFLYLLIGLATDPILAFSFGLVFGIISLPLAIVGMVISGKCLSTGAVSTMSSIGKKLGLVGTIVAGVMLFIAFICLIAGI